MHPVALLFLLACAGAIVASVRSGSAPAVILALLMWVTCAAANLLWQMNTMAWLPMFDLFPAGAGFVTWYEYRSRSLAAFAVIYAARLPSHVLAHAGLVQDAPYKHLINAMFLAALVAISWNGGIADVAALGRRSFYWLRIFLAPPSRALVAAEVARR